MILCWKSVCCIEKVIMPLILCSCWSSSCLVCCWSIVLFLKWCFVLRWCDCLVWAMLNYEVAYIVCVFAEDRWRCQSSWSDPVVSGFVLVGCCFVLLCFVFLIEKLLLDSFSPWVKILRTIGPLPRSVGQPFILLWDTKSFVWDHSDFTARSTAAAWSFCLVFRMKLSFKGRRWRENEERRPRKSQLWMIAWNGGTVV